jgi:hypothetical protein
VKSLGSKPSLNSTTAMSSRNATLTNNLDVEDELKGPQIHAFDQNLVGGTEKGSKRFTKAFDDNRMSIQGETE